MTSIVNTPALTAAVVGCGRIGTFTRAALRADLPSGWLPVNHAEAIRSVSTLRLAALCDVQEEALARACRDHGVEQGFRDYRELMVVVRPEVLAVATRTDIRSEIVRFACENGVRGVHLEKPASRSLAECDAMLQVAAQHHVLLSYGTTRRFMPIYRAARDLIRAGEIGDLVQITVQHDRGPLFWSHPHSADLLIFFAETPEVLSVQAHCTVLEAPVRPDAGGIVDADPLVEMSFVRFAGGVTGLISASAGQDVVLAGTKGRITVGADGAWMRVERKRTPESAYALEHEIAHPDPGAPSGTQVAFEELGAAVRRREPLASIRPEEIRASQVILLLSALSSIHDGAMRRPVDLPGDFTVTGRSGQSYA